MSMYSLTLRQRIKTTLDHKGVPAIQAIVTALIAGRTLQLESINGHLATKVPGTKYDYKLREAAHRIIIEVVVDVEARQHLQDAFDVLREYLTYATVKIRMTVKGLGLLPESELDELNTP